MSSNDRNDDDDAMVDASDEEDELNMSATNFHARPEIRLSRPTNLDEYAGTNGGEVVDQILSLVPSRGKEQSYEIEYEDGNQDVLLHSQLLRTPGGQDALEAFENDSESVGSEAGTPPIIVSSSSSATSDEEERSAIFSRRRERRTASTRRQVQVVDSESEDELEAASGSDAAARRSKRTSGRAAKNQRSRASSASHSQSRRSVSRQASSRRKPEQPARRSSRRATELLNYQEKMISSSSDDEELDLLESDLMPSRKRRRLEDTRDGARTSGRSTRNLRNMQEASLQARCRSDSSDKPPQAPKPTSVQEVFPTISLSEPFAQRHIKYCDSCERPAGPVGALIYCQGCPLAYHKVCIGSRNSRDHLATKVGEDHYVLQCRRCINLHRRKDPMAPDLAICQTCRETGPACVPFHRQKTAGQEQKEREENDGQDPIVKVNSSLLNNAANVLFRCHECTRAFHFHHLPPKDSMMDMGGDDDTVAEERFRDYATNWTCKECLGKPAKISALIAWRPTDPEEYIQGTDTTAVAEDEKEYLLKWEKQSHFQARWAPGAWVWGCTSSSMRRAFSKRNNDHNFPIMTTEEAIPEEYLRIDMVLDVKFTSFVETRAEELDKARIREVDTALMKFKGLGYEDAVWEKAPQPEDGDRWTDFVKAYDDWVVGRHVRLPKSSALKARIEKARSTNFNELEKKEQPKNMIGGKLMSYQLEGLNWLYFRWHQRMNGILADEMGLGKTIQIIGMLATLVEDHNCFPFLLVVPNSTCPNWRREIKQWAPSLRVVTFYGSAQARRLSYEYELYPEGSKTVKCHLVVTSYEAAADDSCRSFFKGVPWQGLIVDEGQRLKSDKTNLYAALSALKIPFSILLTGTPLQNNARELFNLLQFLDPGFDAAALEVEYEELDKENIPKLHEMIRPFFLRRTKAQVLDFLPPIAQVILPVSMSVVQRKLYKSILSKNPDLLKAIFNNEQSVAKANRSNLNNILMQLRKCLAHPFSYSQDIEERNVTSDVSHRNLVDASSKLQLLEVLLPKLKENGHRVLIFSQFLSVLDIVEDFLTGLDFQYQRLDGQMGSLEKQKRIDQYNAPGSELFAFLLSTRAGGVGINLATADTVIILDPDFNPHQDIQALSRAHRIGQTRKVLCFQLMTSNSVEEMIMQIGRKKMALDHVLIERMDSSEEDTVDVESILKFGAAAILEGVEEKGLSYDDSSVEKLLDRSQMEDTKSSKDMTAESQFSFARVWANEAGSLEENLDSGPKEERAPDAGVWDKILQERERAAADEAALRQEALGRGRRTKQIVDYSGHDDRRTAKQDTDSDTDFQEGKSDDNEDDEANDDNDMQDAAHDAHDVAIFGKMPHVSSTNQMQRGQINTLPAAKQARVAKQWRRSNVAWPNDPTELPQYALDADKLNPPPMTPACLACSSQHRQGYCPLKLAGPENCNLCGLAHFGKSRTCPHIRSETQVRAMLAALKHSQESPELVAEATRYLTGVRGTLAQRKRQIAARKLGNSSAGPAALVHVPTTAPPPPMIRSHHAAAAGVSSYPAHPVASQTYPQHPLQRPAP